MGLYTGYSVIRNKMEAERKVSDLLNFTALLLSDSLYVHVVLSLVLSQHVYFCDSPAVE